MFTQFSIRLKLTALVSLLILTLAAVGFLAVTDMRAMNANTDEIASNWLPSIRELGDLRAGVVAYRAALRQHLIALTPEEKSASEKSIEIIVDANAKIRKTYEAMISSPEEHALYEDWSKHWEAYKDVTAKVIDLSRREAGNLPRKAIELNQTAINLGNEADAILRKDIALNDAGATRENNAASKTYSNAIIILASIIAIAIIIGSWISLYMVRDITKGIASIVTPMQALGAGDLDAEVPHHGEKTEWASWRTPCRSLKTR